MAVYIAQLRPIKVCADVYVQHYVAQHKYTCMYKVTSVIMFTRWESGNESTL